MIWNDAPPPPRPRIGPAGWMRVGLRGAALVSVISSGLALALVLRLVERPLFGAHRPVTPHVTVAVCRIALRLMGLRRRTQGAQMTARGAMVCNHVSWIDCFALNAGGPLYYVSKAEVAGWPGIGWLARATGTVFIRRDPREAGRQRDLFAARLRAGHRLLFFPEGTSTDGLRVLPFRSTLFSAFFTQGLHDEMAIQPVTLRYVAPRDAHPAFYGWWGDMDFGPHVVDVLASSAKGTVEIFYHDPVRVVDHADRKVLARELGAIVRAPIAR